MKLRTQTARAASCTLFFIFACCASAQPKPLIKAAAAPEPKAIPAGEVSVVLPERLFNALLDSLFALPQPPTFTLPRGGGSTNEQSACPSEITLEREQLGTRTSVGFSDGQIVAPVAFKGSYSAPLIGCLRFQGWADTALRLSFDETKQALVARVEVRDVHLSKVPAMLNGSLTSLVQQTLDARINPIEILRADQLSVQLPLAKLSNSGSLRLRARTVRHEIAPHELRVHITYEFVRED
jgi:hypothetical protein